MSALTVTLGADITALQRAMAGATQLVASSARRMGKLTGAGLAGLGRGGALVLQKGFSLAGAGLKAGIGAALAALKAPKFDGLAVAVTSLGLDLTIPAPDYTAQEAVAAAVESAAANKTKFVAPWGEQLPYQEGLGSVMFVMGEAAYKAWRDGLLAAR